MFRPMVLLYWIDYIIMHFLNSQLSRFALWLCSLTVLDIMAILKISTWSRIAFVDVSQRDNIRNDILDSIILTIIPTFIGWMTWFPFILINSTLQKHTLFSTKSITFCVRLSLIMFMSQYMSCSNILTGNTYRLYSTTLAYSFHYFIFF